MNYNIKKNKWKSNIKINNLTKTLGYFDNEEEAAKVRDISTKEYFGEFGNLNFP